MWLRSPTRLLLTHSLEGPTVLVTIPAALLLLIVVMVLLRQGYVRGGSALACTAFGFRLASTGIAPVINGLLHTVADLASR